MIKLIDMQHSLNSWWSTVYHAPTATLPGVYTIKKSNDRCVSSSKLHIKKIIDKMVVLPTTLKDPWSVSKMFSWDYSTHVIIDYYPLYSSMHTVPNLHVWFKIIKAEIFYNIFRFYLL